jgi:O-antigen/teichoic acid export membrane protein
LLVLAIVSTYPIWRRAVGHYAGQAERVLRNTAVPMATSFFNRAIDFGFAALLLRILGPKAQGEWGWVIALVGYFEIVTGFGLSALIIREVSRDRGKSGRYLADAIALRVALCALAAPVAAALVLFGHVWLGLGDQALVAFALLALALIPGNLTGALNAVFNAWERTEVPAIIAVGTNLARVSLSTTALLLGAGIVGLATISLGLNLILVVVFVIAARRAIVVDLRGPVPADLPAMLAESYPLLLNNILVTVFFKIDTLLLLPLKGAEAVGYYTAAYKWLDGFLIIPSTFTFAVFPVLSRYAVGKGDGLRAAYDTAIRILLCLALPIAVAVTVLSGDLILLLGGPAYFPASARALAILIWFLPFSYVNGLTQYALIAVHRQRFITGAFVAAAIFNLGANLLLIPRYSFYASSVITVLSEVVLLVPFLYAAGKTIGWPDARRVGGILLAGALMAAIALGARAINPYLALIAGLVVYPPAIWSLGAFSPAEIAILRGLLARLRRRRVEAVAMS